MGTGTYDNMNAQKHPDSLKDAPISHVDKKSIFDFVDYCFPEGLSKYRVLKYILLYKFSFILIKLKQRPYRFIFDLERSNKSEWVKHDYGNSLRNSANGS